MHKGIFDFTPSYYTQDKTTLNHSPSLGPKGRWLHEGDGNSKKINHALKNNPIYFNNQKYL